MDIHEYQAKQLFADFGIATSAGKVAYSVEEGVQNAIDIGGDVWAIKAQIHAGGRGLGGGVKIAKSISEVEQYAKQILGMTLVTYQTGSKGQKVEKIYIEKGIDIHDELYLGIALDRSKEMPIIMASNEGGMQIEEIAKTNPEKIIKIAIDPAIGFQGFHARHLAFGLGLSKEEQKEFTSLVKCLYDLYVKKDAQMIEINPLVKTNNNKFVALDGKISFDDSALKRHPDIEALRDISEEDENEREAHKYNLSYVSLDGEIGCMVNGAGLAMGTMDAIDHLGGTPANFLDVGGKANAHTVAKGFEIILKNKKVKSIFVNIFGGIVRCDRIANGILEAMQIVEVKIPIVIRLDGTNAKEALEILDNAKIPNIISAYDLSDGALKAVKSAKEYK